MCKYKFNDKNLASSCAFLVENAVSTKNKYETEFTNLKNRVTKVIDRTWRLLVKEFSGINLNETFEEENIRDRD